MVKLLLVETFPSNSIILAAVSSNGKTSSLLLELEEVSLEDVSDEISSELDEISLEFESSEDFTSVPQDERIKLRNTRDILLFLILKINFELIE